MMGAKLFRIRVGKDYEGGFLPTIQEAQEAATNRACGLTRHSGSSETVEVDLFLDGVCVGAVGYGRAWIEGKYVDMSICGLLKEC
jgi:hypothetical protein